MNYGDSVQPEYWLSKGLSGVVYRSDLVDESWYFTKQSFKEGYSWAVKVVII